MPSQSRPDQSEDGTGNAHSGRDDEQRAGPEADACGTLRVHLSDHAAKRVDLARDVRDIMLECPQVRLKRTDVPRDGKIVLSHRSSSSRANAEPPTPPRQT